MQPWTDVLLTVVQSSIDFLGHIRALSGKEFHLRKDEESNCEPLSSGKGAVGHTAKSHSGARGFKFFKK